MHPIVAFEGAAYRGGERGGVVAQKCDQEQGSVEILGTRRAPERVTRCEVVLDGERSGQPRGEGVPACEREEYQYVGPGVSAW